MNKISTNEINKIKYELVQNDLLNALNNAYIVQDVLNDFIEAIENIIHQQPQEMIKDIQDGELKTSKYQVEEMIEDLTKSLEIIKNVISGIDK